jgi:hypothetical protein
MPHLVDLFSSVLQGLGRFPLKGDLLSGITTQPGRNFEGVSVAEYMAHGVHTTGAFRLS